MGQVQVRVIRSPRQLKHVLESSAVDATSSSPITTAKQYDWTYSSTWAGLPGRAEAARLDEREKEDTNPWANVFQLAQDPARDRIPVERLGPSSGEPILFYDDVMLYEDELGDNGSSMLNVKVVREHIHAARHAPRVPHFTTLLLARG